MKLSVIITTKNEAVNIAACIESVKHPGVGEIIVVDNFSEDNTSDIARSCGALVYSFGNERSAQRNYGAMLAGGDYLMFVDADMRASRMLMDELVNNMGIADAFYIPEQIAGKGWWNAIRDFERSFYDGTCIDALRVIKRSVFEKVKGYDRDLTGPEDWDLDRRILAITQDVAVLHGWLTHVEEGMTMWKALRKKRYYCDGVAKYLEKWGNDETCCRQTGWKYRMWTVFVENGKWVRAMWRPDLLVCVWVYRVLIGVCYLMRKR